MSQQCAEPKCERRFRASCDCCNKNLCLQHLNEHNALVISQLTPLTDKINMLCHQLQSFNVHEVTGIGREKLEQWRKDCHEKIDQIFEKKCQELDYLFTEEMEQQNKKVLQIKSKIDKLIREQEATKQDIDLLTSEIHQLDEEITKLNITNFQINTYPLVIEDSFIQINKIDEYKIDLSNVAHVHRTLKIRDGSYTTLADNNQFLLVHQKPNLCLIDREMNVVKQVLWSFKSILDMCWSSTLDQFIIIEEENVFILDDKTMSIQKMKNIQNRSCLSCACSNTSLFLSTNSWGSSVLQLRLSPSITMVKGWTSPITCAKDERIDNMTYRNETLAIIIKNNVDKSVRIELRSCETLNRIWSLPLNIISNGPILFRCCSLNYMEWLVTDHENKNLLHITRDGNLKTFVMYDRIPYCAQLLHSNLLIIFTEKGISSHQV
ncbi:unnamed protein product [Adineta steineri]|uniref:Uncharacterized protein n=1 Tax=Adineta steineri TaxID=433720 RepID=A0A819M651_9BILA|nr:unnamed protein product [Adineta steineri]CAF3974295.1 unnamed protein product [Adineta steineri]